MRATYEIAGTHTHHDGRTTADQSRARRTASTIAKIGEDHLQTCPKR